MNTRLPRLHITDLLARQRGDRHFIIRGRRREMDRMARTFTRTTQHNLIIAGARGIGKTALLNGFCQQVLAAEFAQLRAVPYLELDTAQVAAMLRDPQKQEQILAHLQAAFKSLPAAVLVVDEADTLLSALTETWQFDALFQPFFESHETHVVLAVSPEQLEKIRTQHPNCFKYFDVLALDELSGKICQTIVVDQAPLLAQKYQIKVEDTVLDTMLEMSQQLPKETMLPRKVLQFFDEICAACVLDNGKIVTAEHAQRVLAQRLGVPTAQLSGTRKKSLRELTQALGARVQGQEQAVEIVANALQRGLLGLKDIKRPLASFLFLGPSGVGKTELAKALAQEVYGSERSFIRIDMSEFGEAHTVQRLLGAPPGYVGYEAGGQLTNPVAQQPFSLILLDEIEKAHPAVFDIFLQLLDDGRLTDGHGQTVNFTKTILIATSNIGSQEILRFKQQDPTAGNDPTFIKQHLMPLLLTKFRPEFLNRFDRLITFNPLSPEVLLAIAYQEVEKIEQRLQAHHIKIHLNEALLKQKISELYDPRFGARPIKRFIEETCESALAQQLLQN